MTVAEFNRLLGRCVDDLRNVSEVSGARPDLVAACDQQLRMELATIIRVSHTGSDAIRRGVTQAEIMAAAHRVHASGGSLDDACDAIEQLGREVT